MSGYDRKMSNLNEVTGEIMNVAAISIATSNCSSVVPTILPTEKLPEFFGVDFKRWHQKMFFYSTIFSLQRFNSENVPSVFEGTPDEERFLVTKA